MSDKNFKIKNSLVLAGSSSDTIISADGNGNLSTNGIVVQNDITMGLNSNFKFKRNTTIPALLLLSTAGAQKTSYYSSTDGINFTPKAFPYIYDGMNRAYSDNFNYSSEILRIPVSYYDTVWKYNIAETVDGTNWKFVNDQNFVNNASNNNNGMYFVNDTYFWTGSGSWGNAGFATEISQYYTSKDAKSWRLHGALDIVNPNNGGSPIAFPSLVKIAYGNGAYVAEIYDDNYSNSIAYSVDGGNWFWVNDFQHLIFNAGYAEILKFVNGKFVLSSTAPLDNLEYVATSTNGINWQTSVVDGDNGFMFAKSIAYGNGKYILALEISRANNGLDYGVYSSTDLVTWSFITNITNGDLIDFTDVAFYSNKFYLAGNNNITSQVVMYSSTDAVTWTKLTLPTDSAFYAPFFALNKAVGPTETITQDPQNQLHSLFGVI